MLMIKTIIIIILLIFIILFNYSESFTIFNTVDENTPNGYYDVDRFLRILFPSDKNTSSIYQNRFNFIPTTINDNNNTICRIKGKEVAKTDFLIISNYFHILGAGYANNNNYYYYYRNN